MELILIRHGLPLRVENTDGSPADPELGNDGVEQAQKLARWMKDEKLDAIYCSPLMRARMTAKPLADAKDLETSRIKVIKSLATIIAENKGRRVAVVCHGGIINVWGAHILGMKKSLFFKPEYTSVNRFMASSSGVHSLVSLNETGHLRSRL
jgi:probable phosphoglycerate mutase